MAQPPASATEISEYVVRYAQRCPDLRCYVLADPTLRDCRPELRARCADLGEPDALSVTSVRLAPGRLDKSHWPMLIELSPARSLDSELLSLTCEMALQDWQPDSLRQGNGHRVAGWLFSAASADELAIHLAKTSVQARTPTQRTLIRFHDPSVLDLAWDDMDTGQRRAFLGPVAAWQVLGRDGRLATYTAPSDAAQDDEAGESLGFPGPGRTQWTRLDHIGPLNRAWLRIVRTGTYPNSAAIRHARQALLRADARGFRDSDDLVEFAWRALGTSAWFDQHPRVQQRIRDAAPGDSFGFLTADLTEADWHVIGMESNKETGA